MLRKGNQLTLLETGNELPGGFCYRPEFLTPEEEVELIGYFEDLPFSYSRLGEYISKRRVIGFGWSYDFEKGKLVPGPPLPPFLRPLQRKIGKWLDIPSERVAEALITEYPAGSAIGWHRDNESFEAIVGISLSGWCRMRLRPVRKRGRYRTPKDVVALELAPRSAYCMKNESRWDYQHSVAKVEELRYSITFRTLPKGVATPRRPVSLPLPRRR